MTHANKKRQIDLMTLNFSLLQYNVCYLQHSKVFSIISPSITLTTTVVVHFFSEHSVVLWPWHLDVKTEPQVINVTDNLSVNCGLSRHFISKVRKGTDIEQTDWQRHRERQKDRQTDIEIDSTQRALFTEVWLKSMAKLKRHSNREWNKLQQTWQTELTRVDMSIKFTVNKTSLEFNESTSQFHFTHLYHIEQFSECVL